MKTKGSSEALYGIGVIGAAVYFVQHANGFVEVLVGIGKAVFWPGVVLYKVLEMLKL